MPPLLVCSTEIEDQAGSLTRRASSSALPLAICATAWYKQLVDLSFIETPGFTRAIVEHFGSDEDYARLQQALMADPEAGDVIPAAGGVRKLRWPDTLKAKGTRGGLRVIYLHLPRHEHILLLAVYRKLKREDLTSEERRLIAAMAERHRQEMDARAAHRKGRKP